MGEGACSIQDSRATLGRSTIYLIIIILFISFLRALLLSPFVFIWLRKGAYGVSEGCYEGVQADTLRQEVLAILEALDEGSTLGATGARLRGGCHVCRSYGGLIDEKVTAGCF